MVYIRRRRVVLAVLGAVVVMVAVGLVSYLVIQPGESRASGDAVTSGDGADMVRPIDGFAPRFNPASAVVGDGRLFLFGGEKPDLSDGEPISLFRDGVIVDPGTGNAEVLPDAPFKDPLIAPAAVSVDDSVVLVGERCNADQPPEGNAYFCEPYTYAAAVYDVGERSWTSIDMPDALSSVRNGYIAAVGSSAGRALFLLGASTDVWSYSIDKAEWRREADGGDTAVSTCVAGDRVVSVTTVWEQDGVATETTPQSLEPGPGVEYSIAPSDGWVGPTLTSTNIRTGSIATSSQSPPVKYSPWATPAVTCVGDVVVVLANGVQPLLYNLLSDTWVEALSAPVAYVVPARLSTGTELVLLPSGGVVGLPGVALDVASNTWRTLPEIASVPTRPQWNGEAIVGYAEPLRTTDADGDGAVYPEPSEPPPRSPSGVYRFEVR